MKQDGIKAAELRWPTRADRWTSPFPIRQNCTFTWSSAANCNCSLISTPEPYWPPPPPPPPPPATDYREIWQSRQKRTKLTEMRQRWHCPLSRCPSSAPLWSSERSLLIHGRENILNGQLMRDPLPYNASTSTVSDGPSHNPAHCHTLLSQGCHTMFYSLTKWCELWQNVTVRLCHSAVL